MNDLALDVIDWTELAARQIRANPDVRWCMVFPPTIYAEVSIAPSLWGQATRVSDECEIFTRDEIAEVAPRALEEWVKQPKLYLASWFHPMNQSLPDRAFVDVATPHKVIAEFFNDLLGGQGTVRTRAQLVEDPGLAQGLKDWEAGDLSAIHEMRVTWARQVQPWANQRRAEIAWHMLAADKLPPARRATERLRGRPLPLATP